MKRALVSTLALSLILSLSSYATAYAATSTVTPIEISDESTGDITGMNYSDSVGYYLEKEISQGLEFVILGKCNNTSTQQTLIKESHSSSITTFSTTDNSYHNPSTPISKVSGNRTLAGVWWGGILDDVGIVGSVAASTKATTKDTQSKASVKPGLSASWQSSDWKDTDIIASTMASVGISGNKAKWDLQAK